MMPRTLGKRIAEIGKIGIIIQKAIFVNLEHLVESVERLIVKVVRPFADAFTTLRGWLAFGGANVFFAGAYYLNSGHWPDFSIDYTHIISSVAAGIAAARAANS